MSEVERRSAKLHKQSEIDAEEDEGVVDDSRSLSLQSDFLNNPSGVATPTVQSASSSSETSPDDGRPKTVLPPPITRKQTLIRTPALEGTSPPPESFFSQLQPNGSSSSPVEAQTVTNGGDNGLQWQRGKANEAKEFLLTSHSVNNISEDSGRGTVDEGPSELELLSLSRDSSLEVGAPGLTSSYKDSTGVDLLGFFKITLYKSPKDRKNILAIEKELLGFIENKTAQSYKFCEMNGYDRMLVHRVSAYLGLDHNVDQSGKCVIVNKTNLTRVAPVRLSELMDPSDDMETQPKKKILLKKPASLDEKPSRGGSKAQFGSNRAKSLEERQQRYTEARERIFKNEEGVQIENISSPSLLAPTAHIHHQRSLDSMRSAVQQSGNWASSDSSGYESMSATYESPLTSRPLIPLASTPTGSLSDQSQMSRSSSDAGQSPMAQGPPTSYAYLVSSDYSNIPVGSLIINPHTMQPHVNADGTLYQFDPTCPPNFMLQSTATASSPPQTVQPQPHGNILYQNELVDLSSRFAGASLDGVPAVPVAGSEPLPLAIPGQSLSLVSGVAQPSVSQYPQQQYYTSTSPPGQQMRVLTYPLPPHQPQFIPPSPTDTPSGQTTVPMPSVGIPTYQLVPAYPGAQVSGSPQCVDMPPQAYTSYPSSDMVLPNSGLVHYNVAPTSQVYSPTNLIPAAIYTVPVSNQSSSSSPMSHPPPQNSHPQHHHNIQSPIYYNPNPNLVSQLPIRFSGPDHTNQSSSNKALPSTSMLNFSSGAPQLSNPSSHQTAAAKLSQMTVAVGQSLNFSPGTPPNSGQAPILLPHGQCPYQIRPMFQIATPGQPVSPATNNPQFQFIRQPTSIDVRMVNPQGLKPPRLSNLPSLPSLPMAMAPPAHQQIRPQFVGGKPKKNTKKSGEQDGSSIASSQSTPHHQHHHHYHQAPTVLPSHLSTAPSNRQ